MLKMINILKKIKVFFVLLKLKSHLLFFWEHRRPKISLLIPFSSTDKTREKNFKWLIKYWKHELPDAEIIIGKSKGKVFCKGEALNNAYKKSKGRVVAILDADAYISGNIINHCANRILEDIEHHLWYVPYRTLYRLTKEYTQEIIDSDPKSPLRPPDILPEGYYENSGDKTKYGHRYGAMLMMFHRNAITKLGCFDERFKGWGGEDIALLRALDTLYGKHKITRNAIFHLWHPFIGADYKSRRWAGQSSGSVNSNLANQYHHFTRKPRKMKVLVDQGCECLKK